jgi:hypothetical protein
MLDRIAALGMISVFDIEEVGPEVLTGELEIDDDDEARAAAILGDDTTPPEKPVDDSPRDA